MPHSLQLTDLHTANHATDELHTVSLKTRHQLYSTLAELPRHSHASMPSYVVSTTWTDDEAKLTELKRSLKCGQKNQ